MAASPRLPPGLSLLAATFAARFVRDSPHDWRSTRLARESLCLSKAAFDQLSNDGALVICACARAQTALAVRAILFVTVLVLNSVGLGLALRGMNSVGSFLGSVLNTASTMLSTVGRRPFFGHRWAVSSARPSKCVMRALYLSTGEHIVLPRARATLSSKSYVVALALLFFGMRACTRVQALLGALVFGEPLLLLWFAGATLILGGIVLLSFESASEANGPPLIPQAAALEAESASNGNGGKHVIPAVVPQAQAQAVSGDRRRSDELMPSGGSSSTFAKDENAEMRSESNSTLRRRGPAAGGGSATARAEESVESLMGKLAKQLKAGDWVAQQEKIAAAEGRKPVFDVGGAPLAGKLPASVSASADDR